MCYNTGVYLYNAPRAIYHPERSALKKAQWVFYMCYNTGVYLYNAPRAIYHPERSALKKAQWVNFKHFFRIFCRVEQSCKTGRFPAPRRVEPKQTTLKKYIVAEIYHGIYFFSVVCLDSTRRGAGKRPVLHDCSTRQKILKKCLKFLKNRNTNR
eukprot:sb/3473259/